MTDTTELRTARPDVPAWLNIDVLTGTDLGEAFPDEVAGLLDYVRREALLSDAAYVARRVNNLVTRFETAFEGVPAGVVDALSQWSGLSELRDIVDRIAVAFEAANDGQLPTEDEEVAA